MNLLLSIKFRRQEKNRLRIFREKLQQGDRVFVNDGSVAFYAQVVNITQESVRVITGDMRTAAYTTKCIYPVEE